MRVLYIDRHPGTRSKSRLLQIAKRISDSYKLNNRDGFFIASLSTCADVKISNLDKLHKMSASELKGFDAVIFHHLCSFTTKRPGFEVLGQSVRNLSGKLSGLPKILLLATANALDMPSNEILELFDLVYKRERLKDLEKYDLTPENREKIQTTVLSCHIVPATIFNYNRIQPSDYGTRDIPDSFEYDLFFSGMDTSQMRRDLVLFLKSSGVNFTGGLHEDDKPLPPDIKFERLSKKDFYRTIRASRINLAVDGYGQFTYRHWELWCLSAFMISSPAIRDIQLPFNPVEGEHYVAYDNFDDLLDKVRYYVGHPEERDRIARNGRRLFEDEYDFKKHGIEIYTELKKTIGI